MQSPSVTTTPVPTPRPASFDRLDFFDGSSQNPQCGEQLVQIREEARRFRREFPETGTPEYVETFDLVSVPYPTRFGLWRAHRSRSPFLTISNRLVVVRWRDASGGRRTLLFEPTDPELAENVPFYKALSEKTPKLIRPLAVREHGSVEEHLYGLGIDPREVDYLAFDHLHTQDVRRLIGTEHPAADLSPTEPVQPLFPNAKLLVQRSELGLIAAMHPLQSPWYQPETYRDLRTEALLVLDGDVLLGPGVALIATPGHATGNQSLVLNTGSGIWALSENVIATECLTPEYSKIPGLADYARRWGVELILNGNTIENTALQYNSVVKEKSIVDRSAVDGRFLQFFPTSELTPNRLYPGTRPTFQHKKLRHGALVRET